MFIFKFSRISGRFEISGAPSEIEGGGGFFRPPVDISYHDRVFTVRMDIPGIGPENISIEAMGNTLSITGTVPPPERPGPCRLMERPSGRFRRTLDFPGEVDVDRIEASLADGVLTVRVPVPSLERDPTRIEVKVRGAD